MKKYFLILAVFFISTTQISFAQSIKRTANVKTANQLVHTYLSAGSKFPSPSLSECYTDIDYCFERYCYDKKTLIDKSISVCGTEPASRIQINVNECLETRSLIKRLNLETGCSDYTYQRIITNLEKKETVEQQLVEQTTDCKKASRALAAAKNCYAKMISHTGAIDFALYNELDLLCGFNVSGDSYMLNRFYNAGDYGKANVGAIEDMQITGQNTVKSSNWRQIVEATLVGYIEMAELSCGKEDYKITQVNNYMPDSRTNLAMISATANAAETATLMGKSAFNTWTPEELCMQTPLPVGAERWSYNPNYAPACRLACKTNYAPNSTHTNCELSNMQHNGYFMGVSIEDNNTNYSTTNDPIVRTSIHLPNIN